MFDFFKRFIEKLAKQNEQEFKGQAPDCCTINRPDQNPSAQQKRKEE
ncbi:MAG: LDCC motif putative metal-binding protein [Bacillota bacterium]|nr:LDCC motif putative metal-binding protein [Bacillota bacterium]MDW7683138.1 LDCC motif putative metal-binding protein [Bacillota bacterium]